MHNKWSWLCPFGGCEGTLFVPFTIPFLYILPLCCPTTYIIPNTLHQPRHLPNLYQSTYIMQYLLSLFLDLPTRRPFMYFSFHFCKFIQTIVNINKYSSHHFIYSPNPLLAIIIIQSRWRESGFLYG